MVFKMIDVVLYCIAMNIPRDLGNGWAWFVGGRIERIAYEVLQKSNFYAQWKCLIATSEETEATVVAVCADYNAHTHAQPFSNFSKRANHIRVSNYISTTRISHSTSIINPKSSLRNISLGRFYALMHWNVSVFLCSRSEPRKPCHC
jgi:hypothetical protein